jgi:hypothetical protein
MATAPTLVVGRGIPDGTVRARSTTRQRIVRDGTLHKQAAAAVRTRHRYTCDGIECRIEVGVGKAKCGFLPQLGLLLRLPFDASMPRRPTSVDP